MTKDQLILRLSALAVGLVIIETSLVLGVDGAAMLMGGTALGVGLGVPLGRRLTSSNSPSGSEGG